MSDNPWYDIESLNRFIQSTLNNVEPGPVTDNDRKAAAWALLAAIQGRDIRKDIGIAKKRGQRGKAKGKDPELITVDQDVFGVALEWRSGGLKYDDAIEAVKKLKRCNRDTAAGILRDLKTRAENTVKVFDSLYASATKTAPPKRKFRASSSASKKRS